MRRLSADLRREIVDWIVFGLSGELLYGDERDVPPTDCDIFYIEQWKGSRHATQLRRARIAALSDSNLLNEARQYGKIQQLAAVMPRKRGRPIGAGSLAQADEPLLAEIRTMLTRRGLSLHAATQIVASRAPGGGVDESKARRLARRISEKK